MDLTLSLFSWDDVSTHAHHKILSKGCLAGVPAPAFTLFLEL